MNMINILRKVLFTLLFINLMLTIYLARNKLAIGNSSFIKRIMSASIKGFTNNQIVKADVDEEAANLERIRNLPLIFVGGYGRSGTTLMRAILDVHPNISCGPETKVLPVFLSHISKWIKNRSVQKDLDEAGVKIEVIGQASSLFISHIMKHRPFKNITRLENGQRLCAKDPDILHYIDYLHSIFPKAKFVHMVRDGRAAAFSFMLRVRESLTMRKFVTYFNTWNSYNRFIDTECLKLGNETCITVKYEDLVTNTKYELQRVIRFLNETWTDELLRHEQHFHDEIKVSNLEWSTSQIRNKIYNNSLSSRDWLRRIPDFNPNLLDNKVLERYGYNTSLSMPKRNRTFQSRYFIDRSPHLPDDFRERIKSHVPVQ